MVNKKHNNRFTPVQLEKIIRKAVEGAKIDTPILKVKETTEGLILFLLGGSTVTIRITDLHCGSRNQAEEPGSA